MKPLERMAKANYEAESGDGSWDLVSELSQKKLMQYMRAALLALAEAELPEDVTQAGNDAACDADSGPDIYPTDRAFRAICRSIANEGGRNGANT
jgi:hypothetical protein